MSNHRLIVLSILIGGIAMSALQADIINPHDEKPVTRENVKELKEECGADLSGCDDEEKEELYEEDIQEKDEERNNWFDLVAPKFTFTW